MKTTVRVTITGAAGQIGYQLAFRIASGQMLGSDQPVILQLLEIPPALPALQGVVMELKDCAFATLSGIVATDDPNIAFKDSDYALLVGARPRGPGMERKDLLEANAAIFSVQGRAMNDHANSDIKVLVVGNPANTNALIASSNAPDIDPRNFTAMTRLDHNRAMAQLAAKTDSHVNDIRCMTIWGNHSATQYPDLRHASVAGKNAADLVEQEWLVDEFIQPCSNVAQRLLQPAAHHRQHQRRQLQSIICVTGRWARRMATGSAWLSPPTAATTLRQASFIPTPCVAVAASMKSCRGWPLTTLVAHAWLLRNLNCARSVPQSRNCYRVVVDAAAPRDSRARRFRF